VIQIIHREPNDERMAERSEYVLDEISVWQMGCKGILSSDLQCWRDYNVNRKRIRKEMQKQLCTENTRQAASLRLNVTVRGKRIGCCK